MNLFKQSTAASRIVGPVLDSTGAEYASAVIGDLSISKNGGTLTALASAATLTYIANGYYTLALITGNTDTVGTVQITCNKSTYQMPPHIGTVLVAAAFDVLVTNGTIASVSNITAATGVVLSGVTHTGAVIPTVSAVTGLTAANLDASISSRMATYTQPTGFLAATFPTGTVANTTNITAGTITTTTNLTNLPAITTGWLTATGIAADAITAAKVAADVGTEIAVAVASNLGTGSGFTALATQASVNTVDDFLDTEVAAIKAVTDKLDTALVLDVAVYQFTANALELAPTGGSAPTAAAIADAVWDEAISGHLTAGTTGLALNGAGSAGDPWGTALPGAYAAGTAGKIIGDNINATVTSRMASYTQPTGFLAATFPTGTVANTTNITAGTVTTATNVTTVNGIAAAALADMFDTNSGTVYTAAVAGSVVSELITGIVVGSGAADWSTAEKNEIRGRLGITGTTAAGGNTPTIATASDLAVNTALTAAI
jgi:hypothetical protein